MQLKRKKMCGSCIYRRGVLEPKNESHYCHEHEFGDNQSNPNVHCWGSAAKGTPIVTPTPNAKQFDSNFGYECITTAVRNLAKCRGISVR